MGILHGSKVREDREGNERSATISQTRDRGHGGECVTSLSFPHQFANIKADSSVLFEVLNFFLGVSYLLAMVFVFFLLAHTICTVVPVMNQGLIIAVLYFMITRYALPHHSLFLSFSSNNLCTEDYFR